MAARTRTEQRLPDEVPLSGVIVAGSRAAQRPSRDARIAGVLLSLAGAAILMGFITAEALYPGVFTTHTNTVSHLGASEPPNSVVLQPSAAIFDITMLVTGAMILAGAWFAYRALRRKAVLVPTALLGVGTLGVGVFPLTHPAPHTLFALTAFVAGGIAVVLSSRAHHGTVPLPLDGAWQRGAGRDRPWTVLPGVGAGGRARRGRDRAVDRVPDRPVAGGLRQLPDVDSGHSVAARWEPFGLGADQRRRRHAPRSRSHRDLRPCGDPHRIRTVSRGSTGHGGVRWPASSEVEDARARCLRLEDGRHRGHRRADR